jgi:tetratricopeptide (TPR) repeat protein
VEVINLGTTAIASFPVMCIAEETLEYDPDLIVVYSGNNEFYGANGVASARRFGTSTRTMLMLRQVQRSALVQWLLRQTTRYEAEPEGQPTLMEAMIADAQIAPDDARRSIAARNLENHLTRIIERCKQEGVPVIVCTLPANERELAPIGEEIPPSLPDAEQTRFDELLAEGWRLVRYNPAAALDSFTSATKLYDRHAKHQFLIGKCLTALDRHEEALQAYTRAKDLDTMPWRAPSTSNDAVRRATRHGAILCDLEQAFREQSPGGAIGLELMDDHVHATLRGQALIATALLRSMGTLPPPLGVDPERAAKLPSWSAYAQRLGANVFDHYGAAQLVMGVHRTPFLQRTNSQLLSRFESICANIKSHMSAVERRAVREWQESRYVPITGVVGMHLLAAGANSEASALLSVARRDARRYSLRYLHYTSSALEARRRLHNELSDDDLVLARDIIETGEVVRNFVSPEAPAVEVYMGCACNFLGRHEHAIHHLTQAVRKTKNPASVDVTIGPLVDSFLLTGHRNEATQALRGLAADPDLRQSCAPLLRRLEIGPESIIGGAESAP